MTLTEMAAQLMSLPWSMVNTLLGVQSMGNAVRSVFWRDFDLLPAGKKRNGGHFSLCRGDVVPLVQWDVGRGKSGVG